MPRGSQDEYFRKLNAAEKEFIESEIPLSIKELSERYGIEYSTLRRHAKREKWVERELYIAP